MRILKFLFKLFVALFITLVLLVGLGIGAGYYYLNQPEIIVPEKSLRWVAAKFLKPMDVLVEFKTLEIQILRKDEADWYQRQVIVRGEVLKVKMPDAFESEIPDVDLQFLVNVHPKRYGIKSIGPIDVTGARVAIKLPKPDPKKKDEPFDYQVWLNRARHTRFEPIRIGLKSLIIERPGEAKIEGEFLALLQRREGNRWSLNLRADRVRGLPVQKTNFELNVDLPEGGTLLPVAVDVKGQADLGKMGWARLKGNGRADREDKGQFRLDLETHFDRQRQSLRASGQLDQERFSIRLSGEAGAPVSMLQKVAVENCEFAGFIRQKKRPFLQSNVNCVVDIVRVPAPQEKPFQDMLPKEFQFAIKGPVEIADWNNNPSFDAPLSITLKPLIGQLYTLYSTTQVHVSGKVLGGLEGLNADVDVKTQLSLDKFQPMVRRLSETDFSIPAPFNTLDGRIYCNIDGRIRKLGTIINLPLDCGTELMSETQSMFIVAKGAIEKDANQKPVIRLDVGLNKLTFELPKLALNGSVPQIFPDKRIMKAGERREEIEGPTVLPVILDLHIATPAERPLTLVTSLQPTPIPIGIDITIKGDHVQPTGSVGIQDYRVTFLKKKALVDHLRVVLTADEPQPVLDGTVVFDDPDVRIFLKLSGTVDRPFYELESVPPRTPNELLSMLLFGGDSDALDEDNLRSVEETRAAMVDGAIGLLSMYYLASTPIDSVGYNPHTGLFRARVKMPSGLSLTVGSDLGGARQSITLRKRLTESWSFETGAETDEETRKSKGVAMFKWGKRY